MTAFFLIRQIDPSDALTLRSLTTRSPDWLRVNAETRTVPGGPHGTPRSELSGVMPALEDARGNSVGAQRMVSDGGEPLDGNVHWIFRWPYDLDPDATFRLRDGDRWSVAFTCIDVDRLLG